MQGTDDVLMIRVEETEVSGRYCLIDSPASLPQPTFVCFSSQRERKRPATRGTGTGDVVSALSLSLLPAYPIIPSFVSSIRERENGQPRRGQGQEMWYVLFQSTVMLSRGG